MKVPNENLKRKIVVSKFVANLRVCKITARVQQHFI
jgi:hypothetical protein